MNSSQISTSVVVGVLGAVVLGSYIPIGKDQYTKTHDYWLGVPLYTRYIFYGMWVFAALGFLWYVGSTVLGPQVPDTMGLFSHGVWVRPLILGILLLSSAAWSGFVYKWIRTPSTPFKVGTSASLIVTALCTILLLAGEVETNAPWHKILGLVFFAATTVLVDGVVWNAKFLVK